MIRSWISICLIMVISLFAGAIWPDATFAAEAPQLQLLSEVKAGLRVPTRLAVDSRGNLYVADSRTEEVVKYDPYGQIDTVFKIPGMTGDGLAVTADGGKIYVSAQDRVLVLQTSDLQMAALGRGLAEFSSAGFIAVDSQGFVYVADLGAVQVKVYNAAGLFHKSLSGPFKTISSLAVATHFDDDVSNDEVFITDSFVGASSRPALYVYNAAGGLLRSLSASTDFATPVRIFGKPAFDHAGRYYFGDVEQNKLHVMAFAASSTIKDTPLVSPLATPGDLISPIDSVFDDQTQRLFVLYGDRSVWVYGVDGGKNPVKVNRAPGLPALTAPVAGSEVDSGYPLLQFANAIDPDVDDVVSYQVQLFDQTQQLIASYSVAEQSGVSAVRVDTELVENHQYFWQVQATDGQAASDWTELQSFYVNAVQEAPAAPQLVSPLAGVAVKDDALLSWQASIDNDPYDQVSYEVVVATDAELTDLVYSETLSGTSLAMLDWSPALKPGSQYFWQVAAIDNHGLAGLSTADGRFTFQATLLSVTANMPAAKVYLGGNVGYAGQFVGTAPLELRGLEAGHYQVVVERAGFEPFMQSVEVLAEHAGQVYAPLQPALQAGKLKFKDLKIAGEKVRYGVQVAPLLADFDLDGAEDLVLASADGVLHYHPGTVTNEAEFSQGLSAKRKLVFGAEQKRLLPQVPGAAPCLVDWNNDNRQDLLIGGADGSVQLFLGSGEMDFAAEGTLLTAVSGAAVPAVIDIDNDGDKDLVVGSDDGEIVLLTNQGSDALPLLDQPQLLVAFAEAAAPYFADWDGNGQRELLVVVDGELYRGEYVAGALEKMTRVATGKEQISSINVQNIDRYQGFDLLAGTADGRLLLAKNHARQPVEAFYPALSEKVSVLARLVGQADTAQLPLVEKIAQAVEQRSLASLLDRSVELSQRLPTESVALPAVTELVEILNNLSFAGDKD